VTGIALHIERSHNTLDELRIPLLATFLLELLGIEVRGIIPEMR
jgi:hypothetical protein